MVTLPVLEFSEKMNQWAIRVSISIYVQIYLSLYRWGEIDWMGDIEIYFKESGTYGGVSQKCVKTGQQQAKKISYKLMLQS